MPANLPPKLYENFWLDASGSETVKIGLYCGSFNPIHVAHARLCSYVLEHTELQKLWLVVSARNPFKEQAGLMADELRLELARLALKDTENVYVSDVEMLLPRPSYTINTIDYLKEHYPNAQFVLLMGADNVPGFGRWKNSERILEEVEVWAFRRPGCSIEQDQYPHIRFIDSPLMDVSSTEIRSRLQNGQPITGLVHPDVERRIAEIVNEKGVEGLF